MNSRFEFTVISTFSGCGGSSLGYHLAGGKVLLAVEWNKAAADTYRANFPDTPIFNGDIKALDEKQCLQLARIKTRELDIFDGSPPCQGFSLSGKRQFGDTRNQLFSEYLRLLEFLQPKVFVMENVSGLAMGKMGLIFAEIMQGLKRCGYVVRARILNAQYYGVPQNRLRIFFIGVRKDLRIEPCFPKPIGRPITTREAIGHLNERAQSSSSRRIVKAWLNAKPGQSLRKVIPNTGSFQVTKLDPNKPSRTLTRGGGHWHYAYPRRITLKEAALLQSFPESFRWPSGISASKDMIGNSVAPLMMKAIAETIRDNILRKINS